MLARESFRYSWKADVFILLGWLLWLVWTTSLTLPFWLSLTGVSWILLYAASRWSGVQAALLFLLMGWVFHSISLTPSGLFWLSMMIMYVLVKLAQFRLMIRNAFQFASSVFATAMGFELLQLFFLSRIHPESGWGWAILGSISLSAFLHAVIGFFLYPVFLRLMEKK